MSDIMQKHFIPSEELKDSDSVYSWTLPDVTSKNHTVQAGREQQKGSSTAGFVIEDVTAEDVADMQDDPADSAPVLPAHELKRITDDAYQQGFQKGLEDGRAAGFSEGQSQGHAEGYNQGQEQLQKELTAELEKLQRLARKLVAPMEGRQEQVEAVLLQLVQQAVIAVTKQELATSETCIKNLIQESLALLPVDVEGIEVFLHPDDFQRLDISALPQGSKLSIDESLSQGGCRVVSAQSEIDQTLESRLAQVFAQILTRQHQAPDAVVDNDDHQQQHEEQNNTDILLDESMQIEDGVQTIVPPEDQADNVPMKVAEKDTTSDLNPEQTETGLLQEPLPGLADDETMADTAQSSKI